MAFAVRKLTAKLPVIQVLFITQYTDIQRKGIRFRIFALHPVTCLIW